MRKDLNVFIGHSNEQFLDSVRGYLDETYTLSTSSCGKDIVNKVIEIQPDLAILDFAIPEIDILQWCEKLSADHPEITTVIHVGIDNIQQAKRKWRKRALDYIIGPLGPEEFVEEVNKVIRYVLIEREREQLIRNKIELQYLLTKSLIEIRGSLQHAVETQDWTHVESSLKQMSEFEESVKELDSLK